jgi:hypothetical protein
MVHQMQAAHAASVRDLLPLMEDCWCDLLPSIIAEEWKVGQKGRCDQLCRRVNNTCTSSSGSGRLASKGKLLGSVCSITMLNAIVHFAKSCPSCVT